MRTSITSTPSPVITAAIFGALVLCFGATCRAHDSDELPQIVVNFQDLNLSAQQDAAMLYRRIAAAADQVCDSHGTDWNARARARACAHKALADAVTKLGRPELLATYNAKNHRPAPTTLANARK